MKITSEQVLACCREMVAREENQGCWVGGKIPDCFIEVRDNCGIPDFADNIQWLMIVEGAVKNEAVKLFVEICDSVPLPSF